MTEEPTTTGGYTCPFCGVFVPLYTFHNCPRFQNHPIPTSSPMPSMCSCWELLPELKRIADALEKLVIQKRGG